MTLAGEKTLHFNLRPHKSHRRSDSGKQETKSRAHKVIKEKMERKKDTGNATIEKTKRVRPGNTIYTKASTRGKGKQFADLHMSWKFVAVSMPRYTYKIELFMSLQIERSHNF